MKYMNINSLVAGGLFFLLASCQPKISPEIGQALTFYASFDTGTAADFALGDPHIYSAKASYINSKRKLDGVQVGLNNSHHGITEGKGRFGNAFEFGEKSNTVLFYKSKDNIAYDPQNWSGSISFWLSVDPSTDLDGYTDPIQITDANFNDASIWVDFTDDDPPGFRLGVIGDKSAWTLDTLKSSFMEEFEKRLVSIEKPQFSRNSWTHILITYDGLGTLNSLACLYLNGKKIGTINGIDDPFTWELEQSNIFLGLGFTGLLDELSIFNQPLTEEQALELYQLKDGIRSLKKEERH